MLHLLPMQLMIQTMTVILVWHLDVVPMAYFLVDCPTSADHIRELIPILVWEVVLNFWYWREADTVALMPFSIPPMFDLRYCRLAMAPCERERNIPTHRRHPNPESTWQPSIELKFEELLPMMTKMMMNPHWNPPWLMTKRTCSLSSNNKNHTTTNK